jgi:hypothetical protein
MTVKNKSLQTPPGQQTPAPAAVSELLNGVKSYFDEATTKLVDTTAAEVAKVEGRVKAVDEQLAAQAKEYEAKIEIVRDAGQKKADEINAMLKEMGVKLDSATDRLEDIEAKGQRPPVQSKLVSPGELALKGINFGPGGKILVPRTGGYSKVADVPSMFDPENPYGAKATVLASSELSGAAVPVYRDGILDKMEEKRDIANLLPYVGVPGAESYVIRKETVKSRDGVTHTTLAVDLDGTPTPKTTATLTSVDGLAAGMFVTFHAAARYRLKCVSFDSGTKVVTFATNAITFDMTAGGDVTFETYGTTAEEAAKPYGFLEIEAITESFATLATVIAITNQRLNAAPALNNWIQGKMRSRARRNLSWHVLYGTGTNSLDGFASESGVQTYAWSSGSTGDNRLDAMVRASASIVGSNPVTLVMNKNDLFKLMLLKGSDGHYLQSARFGTVPITGVNGQIYVGPYPVVIDAACLDDEFFAIDFANASELVDQQTSALMFGYIDDDFTKNIIRMRYEDALIHAILTTDAYVYGSWDAAPS